MMPATRGRGCLRASAAASLTRGQNHAEKWCLRCRPRCLSGRPMAPSWRRTVGLGCYCLLISAFRRSETRGGSS
eukprot:2274494-Heterocapsa_arctica.AAC.1